MLKQWIIFSFLLILSSLARAVDFQGLGVQAFGQTLNSGLTLQDKEKREVTLTPDPPSFTGVGASYKGFGAAYAWSGTSEQDRAKKSDASGFKWTVPYKHFLFEYYNTRFEGAEVEGSLFRPDIDVFAQGLHVTWSRRKDLDFSRIFGLETDLSKGNSPYETHTYYTASIQESVWRGDTKFWTVTATTTEDIAFRYIRRRTVSAGIGRTYIKYFDNLRFSALGNIGPFVGNRLLKYEAGGRSENKESETGISVSAGFSVASDVGFRRLGKQWGVHFNYGINMLFHYNNSFGSENIGTTQTATELYLGALW